MARIEKVNDEIRSCLSTLLSSVKDPRVRGLVSVVRVQTTPDLKQARIFISVFDDSTADDVLAGLRSAGGYLRRGLGRALNLRNTPELIFLRDESIKHGAQILELLQSVQDSFETSPKGTEKEPEHEGGINDPK